MTSALCKGDLTAEAPTVGPQKPAQNLEKSSGLPITSRLSPADRHYEPNWVAVGTISGCGLSLQLHFCT
jgi:hypothetical protein